MQNTGTFAQRLASNILRYRWLTLVGVILLILGAASGGQYLVFNNDYRAFFHEDNPELKAFEHMEKTYSGRDETVLVVLAPKNGQVFTRETLGAVEKFTEYAWQAPYSTRVDSITNFQYSHANGDELVVAELVRDAASLSDAELNRVRDIALQEPLLRKQLISEQGHVTAINITIQLPGKNPVAEEPEVVNFARDMAEKIRTEYPELDVHLTGMVMLNAAFGEAAEMDMSTLMPITLLVFLVCIAVLMRGWTGAFVSFWMIIFSILFAMGMAGWLRIDLTSVSSSAPTIILTLAISNAVHILTSFYAGMRKGNDKYTAMYESLVANTKPVFLVNFTTALGFLTMNFSESPVFGALGNIVAMGVVCAMVLSLTFLPALMMLLPVRKPKQVNEGSRAMAGLAEFVIRRKNSLLVGMGGVCVLLAMFIANNDLNDEWVQYFGKGMEFRKATDFTTDNLTGVYRIDYSLNAAEADGISDPDFLRKVEAFGDWYRQQPEVVQVSSIIDTMKRLNKNMHGDDPAQFQIPANRELAAQYLLLYEMSLPYGLDLNNQINMDKSATRMTVTIKNLPVKETLALENRAQDWLKANAPELKAIGTGSTIMFAHIGVRNILGMIMGTAIGLVLISLILVYVFKSVKIGLISLIPNLIPSVMGFGLWGILVGEVGLGLATVAGVTMGIVVDDTIHFLSRYLRARRELRLNPEDAVRYAFTSVGTALWFTTFILVAGFSVLAFSEFKLNSDMGILTGIILVFALIADFLLLPALLMKLDRDPQPLASAQPQPAVQPVASASFASDGAAVAPVKP